MTHQDQSAVRGMIDELLHSGRDGDHGEVMRRLLQAALQDLIDAEATARIGAGRYERNSERVTHRNGALRTCGGWGATRRVRVVC